MGHCPMVMTKPYPSVIRRLANTLSWWLQMPWRQTGTRLSAAIIYRLADGYDVIPRNVARTEQIQKLRKNSAIGNLFTFFFIKINIGDIFKPKDRLSDVGIFIIKTIRSWHCLTCMYNGYSYTDKMISLYSKRPPGSSHIEAETEWPPFCRRPSQMHFLEWKYINSD